MCRNPPGQPVLALAKEVFLPSVTFVKAVVPTREEQPLHHQAWRAGRNGLHGLSKAGPQDSRTAGPRDRLQWAIAAFLSRYSEVGWAFYPASQAPESNAYKLTTGLDLSGVLSCPVIGVLSEVRGLFTSH